MAYSQSTTPYLVDLHVHGAGEYDTQTRRQDDIQRIAALHGSRGTSAILPTIYPADIEIMRDNLNAVKRAMDVQRDGAKVLGAHIEGPFLNTGRAGSLDPKSFLDPDRGMLERLVEGYEDVIRIVTIAPELPGALKLIELCRAKGFLVQMGHSDATFEQAEEGKRAGATGITHLFNAMRGFHHREPGLAGFGLMDEDVYVEVIADMVHLHPSSLRMVLDMKPPDRIIVVSDSVKGPEWGSGPVRGPGGMLMGSGVSLMDCVRNLEAIGVPQDRAMHFATDNPVAYLGLKHP